MEMMRLKVIAGVVMTMALMPFLLGAVEVGQLKEIAAAKNVSCILVFGDSSVDPGNNNILHTKEKGNFPPYGKNFFGGRPTGRFSNGRLATDFIAEELGYLKVLPAYLSSNVKQEDLIHGVSFASAASGYDDLTANYSNVLSMSKQMEYLMHFKIKLRKMLGERKTEDIIRKAIFIISMGTNDFLQNYYLEPARSKQFTVQQYQKYLASLLVHDVQKIFKAGGTRLVVVGVPPIGCMPLVKTLMGVNTKCWDNYNKVASSLNSMIQKELNIFKANFGMKTAFVDAYHIIQHTINNPHLYGIEETSKGCCGTGTIEYGDTCKGLNTCKEPSKYVFWDAVHPTEKIYKILAEEAIRTAVTAKLLE